MQSISQNRSSANTGLRTTSAQLPIWPENVRGGPNAILRSALFAGIHSKKRRVLGSAPTPTHRSVGVPIASQDGISITFAGTQFNQYDADVFFETLHRARRASDTSCDFRGAELLRSIGRTDSKTRYADLEESLDRLRWGSLEVYWEVDGRKYRFSGSLIASYIREETSKLYRVTFPKEILILFAPASWTQLEWQERQSLSGQPLAQWLHSYFSTHAAPFPISVAFIHEKSGSPTTLLKHFKTELKNSLGVLEETLGWTATWKKQLVTVSRTPSDAQTRHIARKTARVKREKAVKYIQQRQLGLPTPQPQNRRKTVDGMSTPGDILSALFKER